MGSLGPFIPVVAGGSAVARRAITSVEYGMADMVLGAFSESPVSWAWKSAEEVVEVAEHAGSIVLFPVGSVEQHGPHLPTITDTYLATRVAYTAAERVQDRVPVLVAPPVCLGNSDHHLPFGGTISVNTGTLEDMLVDAVTSAGSVGFANTVMVNGHGANATVISHVVDRIERDAHDYRVYGLTYFNLIRDEIEEIRQTPVGGMGHAGEFETSLMLYLCPDHVDQTKVEDASVPAGSEFEYRDMFARGVLTSNQPMPDKTRSGILGNPQAASPETGERIFQAVTYKLENLLLEIAT